jgi:hypothetical protein
VCGRHLPAVCVACTVSAAAAQQQRMQPPGTPGSAQAYPVCGAESVSNISLGSPTPVLRIAAASLVIPGRRDLSFTSGSVQPGCVVVTVPRGVCRVTNQVCAPSTWVGRCECIHVGPTRGWVNHRSCEQLTCACQVSGGCGKMASVGSSSSKCSSRRVTVQARLPEGTCCCAAHLLACRG